MTAKIEIQKRVPVTVDGRVIPGLRVEPQRSTIIGGLLYTVYVNNEEIFQNATETDLLFWAQVIDKIIPLAVAAEKFKERDK